MSLVSILFRLVIVFTLSAQPFVFIQPLASVSIDHPRLECDQIIWTLATKCKSSGRINGLLREDPLDSTYFPACQMLFSTDPHDEDDFSYDLHSNSRSAAKTAPDWVTLKEAGATLHSTTGPYWSKTADFSWFFSHFPPDTNLGPVFFLSKLRWFL